MYIPPKYQLKDEPTIVNYIRQYPFATLITMGQDAPIATHLPFIIEEDEGQWYLLGHMAKANPQWQALPEQQALIIFQEPHAYISPSYYDKEENVPTWNYVAVHVYGQTTLLLEEEQAIEVLEKSMHVFEKSFLSQWNNLRIEYKQRLLKGMVAFKLKIERWQGKEKLSQNKTLTEQQTIAEGLSHSNDNSARELGQIMKDKLQS